MHQPGAVVRGRITLAAAAADDHARGFLPLLRTVRNEGSTTLAAISCALNERKIPTPRGTQWHVSTVANPLARAQSSESCASESCGLL